MATYEELIALGYDEETAKRLASNNVEAGSGGIPFDVIKINYDKEDILSEAGVRKGEFITGWKINKNNFSIEEEGKVFEKPLEFIVIAQGYQYSSYDVTNGGYKYITPIFTNPFDAKNVRELKTGLKVSELKAQGEKLTFNNILLLLVKENNEWQPYLMYLRGTNYMHFQKQLEERGINPKAIGLKYIIKVNTKKVPTQAGIPAWVMDIVEVKELEPKMLIELKDIIANAIKKWDEWRKSSEKSNEVKEEKVETETYEEDDDIDTHFD